MSIYAILIVIMLHNIKGQNMKALLCIVTIAGGFYLLMENGNLKFVQKDGDNLSSVDTTIKEIRATTVININVQVPEILLNLS